MKHYRTFRPFRFSTIHATALAVAFFLLPAFFCSAQTKQVIDTKQTLDATTASKLAVSPAPGVYAAPQIVQFAGISGTRLVLTVDGSPLSDPLQPILLSVNDGEDRTFVIQVWTVSLSPDSKSVPAGTYTWRIDRKKPVMPVFSSSPVEGGLMLAASIREPGTVRYHIYHPYYRSNFTGISKTEEPFFVPEGAVIYAEGIDEAGNCGPAGIPSLRNSPSAPLLSRTSKPFRVDSPVSGTWANRQLLLVSHDESVTVYFSLDGSDPSVSGLIYTDPVLLDSTGLVTLRVLALTASGEAYSEKILFSVLDSAPPQSVEAAANTVLTSAGLNTESGMLDAGAFTELRIPDSFRYSLGDGTGLSEGGKTVLFSATRGMSRYYPLVVSDGARNWRWMCNVQGAEDAGVSAATGVFAEAGTKADPTEAADPRVSILDWHFFTVQYNHAIYYSFDRTHWNPLVSPVFLERVSVSEVYWYSPDWKAGEVQRVSLPPKPVLSGLPAAGITADPVFISLSGTPFTVTYEAGSGYWPQSPSHTSPVLSSGLLVEVPAGSSGDFAFRFKCEYDGIVHGEIPVYLVVDRKAPRSPSLNYSNTSVFSRVPCTIKPTGEDMVQISIEPPLFSSQGTSFVLDGDPRKPVVYSVRLFAVDRAGNRSEESVYTITVDLNALYIDGSLTNKSGSAPDGSPLSPFKSIDEAFDVIRDTGMWRLYVQGSVPMSKKQTVMGDITITGNNAKIIAGTHASFVVSSGKLEMSACEIERTLSPPEVYSASSVYSSPLFDVYNAKLSITGSSVIQKGGDSSILVRGANSTVSASSSFFSLDTAEYAVAFDSRAGILSLSKCRIEAGARTVSGISLFDSRAAILDTRITVIPVLAARAIESWGSSISLTRIDLRRNGPANSGKIRDTAFWYDPKTVITEETSVVSTGFSAFKAQNDDLRN